MAAAKALTTKVLAIGVWTAKATPEARPAIMPFEARDTLRLQLAGKIDQWFAKSDGSGAVFLMNVTDPAEAHQLLEDAAARTGRHDDVRAHPDGSALAARPAAARANGIERAASRCPEGGVTARAGPGTSHAREDAAFPGRPRQAGPAAPQSSRNSSLTPGIVRRIYGVRRRCPEGRVVGLREEPSTVRPPREIVAAPDSLIHAGRLPSRRVLRERLFVRVLKDLTS